MHTEDTESMTNKAESEDNSLSAFYRVPRCVTEEQGRILLDASNAPVVETPFMKEVVSTYKRIMSEKIR